MKKINNNSLMAMVLCTMLGIPGTGMAIDSFFDITYDLRSTSRGETPLLTATLADGSEVPLETLRVIKFVNENKGLDLRIIAKQALGSDEFVLVSASCVRDRCVISNVEQKGYEFRGHVTVLK